MGSHEQEMRTAKCRTRAWKRMGAKVGNSFLSFFFLFSLLFDPRPFHMACSDRPPDAFMLPCEVERGRVPSSMVSCCAVRALLSAVPHPYL